MEEGEVLPPSPHRHLQRVLSFNGTIGLRAKHTLLWAAQSQTSSPRDPCHSLFLHIPASLSVSSRLWSPSGPSGLFLSFIGY